MAVSWGRSLNDLHKGSVAPCWDMTRDTPPLSHSILAHDTTSINIS